MPPVVFLRYKIAAVIKITVMIIAQILTVPSEKTYCLEVSTPRVPNQSHEKSEVSEPNKRFKAMAAIKVLARVFSIINANKMHSPVQQIVQRVMPAATEPVNTVKA